MNNKLTALRARMRALNIDAYMIPSADDHQSEYVAPHWQTRAWFSGFTGSTGLAIVTADHAGLWTDSRYFIQAESELAGTDVVLHKLRVPHTPEHLEWLQTELPDGATIGVDGRQMSAAGMDLLRNRLAKKNFRFLTEHDLIGDIWTDRPALPDAPVFEHELKYTGRTRGEKLAELRARMVTENYLVTGLDELCWLLNLRGSDVESNPLFYGFLLLDQNAGILYVDATKINDAILDLLMAERIRLKPVADLVFDLEALNGTIAYAPGTLNETLRRAIPEPLRRPTTSLIALPKSKKTDTEIAHLRRAMERDGVALLRLVRWLRAELGTRAVPESEVAEYLADLRRAGGRYHDESFPAIVGYAGNGAIVHYRPEAGKDAAIRAEGILLLDSGGQYHDGTTDITRTFALGVPTAEQRRNYTLVLKGHINVARLKFPRGTAGVQLDALARAPLWSAGLNYGHGTGHGVGFFLNVHEGPQSISHNVRSTAGRVAFEPGMITSNEPGFYKTGEYGIRIENLVLCRPAQTTEYGDFLEFEDLTLFPMESALIDAEMLSYEERKWLSGYHQMVFERLSRHLTEEEVAWLREACGVYA